MGKTFIRVERLQSENEEYEVSTWVNDEKVYISNKIVGWENTKKEYYTQKRKCKTLSE